MSLHPNDLDSSLLTRASLLQRLRNWDDSLSWAEFHRIYAKLVYRQGRRAGLNHSEAEEVTQDVFRAVADSIGNFAPHPRSGSFRRWLYNLTRWRVIDSRRQEDVMAPHVRAHLPDLDQVGAQPIEGLADPARVEEESQETDWRALVLEAALARVAKKVPAKKIQVFQLYTQRNWSASRIARELGMSTASVYLIYHRLSLKLSKEVKRLSQRLDRPPLPRRKPGPTPR